MLGIHVLLECLYELVVWVSRVDARAAMLSQERGPIRGCEALVDRTLALVV